MSPRLIFQPTIVSYLFLGLTLYLLQRPEAAPETAPSTWFGSTRRRWLLPILFALWVNLDAWYLLGPVTVALYLAGEFVQDQWFRVHASAETPKPHEFRQLAIILGVGLAACLLSPYHVRALALPAELSLMLFETPLRNEGWFDRFFDSPFSEAYLFPRNIELYQNTTAWAYIVLGIVAIASFLCNLGEIRWWRLLVFVPFALLGAWWVRAVPFFAVVAGPIAALNFQDLAARLAARPVRGPTPQRRLALIGRLGTALIMTVVLALAWGGLLHAHGEDSRFSRRVSWGVHVNDSFQPAAEVLTELRRQGVLGPESHAFNLSPEAAAYCAWFCPEEKCFFDLRLTHFSDRVANDYVKARQDLEYRVSKAEEAVAAGQPLRDRKADTIWPSLFRNKNYRIDHVIFTGVEWRGLRDTVRKRFWNPAGPWTMLYGDGRTMVFGWNDRSQGEQRRFHNHGMNLLAAGLDSSAAPEAEISEVKPGDDWWSWYAYGPAPRPVELDQSAMLLDYYSALARYEQKRQEIVAAIAQLLSGGTMAACSTAAGPIPALMASRFTLDPGHGFFLGLQPTAEMSAVALLSERAARKSLKKRPNDPQADYYLALSLRTLGELQLTMATSMLRPGQPVPPGMQLLNEIRQVQMAHALTQAVRHKPDFTEAHKLLSEVYAQTHLGNPLYLSHVDLCLNHLQTWAELRRQELDNLADDDLRRAGKKEVDALFRRRLREIVLLKRRTGQVTGPALSEEELKTPEEFLNRLRSAFSLKAENQPDPVRLGLALEFGLAEDALEVANRLADDFTSVPPQQRAQVLNLVIVLRLKSGMVEEAKGAEERSDQTLVLMSALGDGDYALADDILADQIANHQREQRQRAMLMLQKVFSEAHPNTLQLMRSLPALKAYECNMRVLRGVAALERGDSTAASTHFTAALRAKGGTAAVDPLHFHFELAPLARVYLDQIAAAKKAPAP